MYFRSNGCNNDRDIIDPDKLYVCKDNDIHNYLYKDKSLMYIRSGVDDDGVKYYVYFKSALLEKALAEFKR
jgi:hypothetical protein